MTSERLGALAAVVGVIVGVLAIVTSNMALVGVPNNIELSLAVASVVTVITVTIVIMIRYSHKEFSIKLGIQEIERKIKYVDDSQEEIKTTEESFVNITNEDLMKEIKKFEENISREDILNSIREIQNSAKKQLFIGIAGSSAASGILSYVIAFWPR